MSNRNGLGPNNEGAKTGRELGDCGRRSSRFSNQGRCRRKNSQGNMQKGFQRGKYYETQTLRDTLAQDLIDMKERVEMLEKELENRQ